MKLHLDFDFDFSFLLFGISSRVPDYHLCWHMNRALKLEMYRSDAHTVVKKGLSGKYERFTFSRTTNDCTTIWNLVANHSHDGALLKQHRTFDYLFVVDTDDEVDAGALTKRIHELPVVLACYKIDPQAIKQRENLIFDS